jgi:hypothetical protein
MNETKNLIRVLVAVSVVGILGSGCQTYKTQAKSMTSAWSAGNMQQAATEFGKKANALGPTHSVIWHLEAGAAYRAVGDFTNSNRHFDAAEAQIDKFDEEAKVKVGVEAAAIMSNQQNLPYTGRSYDKIMLHTYQALNYLSLGEADKVRPEIIRAYQCQQDAVEDNKQRIEKAQEAAQKSKDSAYIEKTKANPKFDECQQTVLKEIEGFSFYADYVNPFTVYLDGLYFLHAGVDGSDLERARKSLSRVFELTGSNKFIQADLQLAENGGNAKPSPCTYVIFETGQAASRDQIRIDIPIIIIKLSYVGTAFPKLALHNDHASELTVKAGDVEEKTLSLASMDSVVALDYKNEWPVILTKTLISTVAKAVADYAVNDAVSKSTDNIFVKLGARVATAAIQASVNIADTRSWTTLPKMFQVARIATPPDRKLVLSTSSAAPVEVALMDGVVNVVHVRSITANAPLLVNQFKLK